MYKTLKISLTSLLIAATAFIALFAYQVITSSAAVAHEDETSGEHEHSEEQAEGDNPGYTYSAQAGDTYTQIARKAIQTYGLENNLTLTPAEIIFAETNLTQEAGAEELAIGQEVSVSGELVKKWIDTAGQLSEAEQATWDVYVSFVDFNTDRVGENS